MHLVQFLKNYIQASKIFSFYFAQSPPGSETKALQALNWALILENITATYNRKYHWQGSFCEDKKKKRSSCRTQYWSWLLLDYQWHLSEGESSDQSPEFINSLRSQPYIIFTSFVSHGTHSIRLQQDFKIKWENLYQSVLYIKKWYIQRS